MIARISAMRRSGAAVMWTSAAPASVSDFPRASIGDLSARSTASFARLPPVATPKPKRLIGARPAKDREQVGGRHSNGAGSQGQPGDGSDGFREDLVGGGKGVVHPGQGLGELGHAVVFEGEKGVGGAGCSSAWASAACWTRRRPSKEKGMVASAKTSAPWLLANSAQTGAAPLPTPPPSPAQMMTICAPANAELNSADASSAASAPTSGSPPVPSPRAVFEPMRILRSATELPRETLSVLMATRSRALPKPASVRRVDEGDAGVAEAGDEDAGRGAGSLVR